MRLKVLMQTAAKKTEGEKKDALHSVFVALYVINVTERFG